MQRLAQSGQLQKPLSTQALAAHGHPARRAPRLTETGKPRGSAGNGSRRKAHPSFCAASVCCWTGTPAQSWLALWLGHGEPGDGPGTCHQSQPVHLARVAGDMPRHNATCAPRPWLPTCRLPARRSCCTWLRKRAGARRLRRPLGTRATNVMGTAPIMLPGGRSRCARAVVVVTTDKVYRNREWAYLPQDDPLGGHDPSLAPARRRPRSSPPATAMFFWPRKGVAVATARAGNDWRGDWAADTACCRCRAPGAPGSSSPSATPKARALAACDRAAGRLLSWPSGMWADPARAGAYNWPAAARGSHRGYVVKWPLSAYPEAATSYENHSEGRTGVLAGLQTARPPVPGRSPAGGGRQCDRTVAWYPCPTG